jgi:hypothetical protein
MYAQNVLRLQFGNWLNTRPPPSLVLSSMLQQPQLARLIPLTTASSSRGTVVLNVLTAVVIVARTKATIANALILHLLRHALANLRIG